MSKTKPTIAVLGAGSWGTALAILLARNSYPTQLWGNEADNQARMAKERANTRYLPGIGFPDLLQVQADFSAAVESADHFLLVVPSHAFRSVLKSLRPHLKPDSVVAWGTKGMDPESGKLLSQVADELLGSAQPSGIVSGPTFAMEVAKGLPAAMTTAAQDLAVAETIAHWLRNERVRVYPCQDRVGVELGGGVKNIMAIAAGISDGLGFGANARAALITRGLAEIRRLAESLGGKPETFMGLAGIGDLVLTCTDNQSRNRRVGLALGQGQTLPEILKSLGQVAEGVATAREVHHLAQRLQVDMPITEQVYRVLFEHLAPQAAVEALLRREPRPE